MTLHNFEGSGGVSPFGRLLQGTDSEFYGTTEMGGTNGSCGPLGCGTIFKMNATGTRVTLHSFELTDGAFPTAGLNQSTNGTFYGTTLGGGTTDDGTVLRLGAEPGSS